MCLIMFVMVVWSVCIEGHVKVVLQKGSIVLLRDQTKTKHKVFSRSERNSHQDTDHVTLQLMTLYNNGRPYFQGHHFSHFRLCTLEEWNFIFSFARMTKNNMYSNEYNKVSLTNAIWLSTKKCSSVELFIFISLISIIKNKKTIIQKLPG